MCPPLLRELPAERERVGGIDSARDDADQRFIVLRFGPRYFFDLQYLWGTVLVGNHRFHHWFFTDPQCAIGAKDCEKSENPDHVKRFFHTRKLGLRLWRWRISNCR